MDQVQPVVKKHMKSFWPLTIIFFLAVIAAGLVFWVSYNQSLQDDLDSLVVRVHKNTATTTQNSTQTKKVRSHK